MSVSAKSLEVTFAGIIAYVPEGDTLWALLPDASVPQPAQWMPAANLMAARSPHLPFMIVEESLIDYGKSQGVIDAFFREGFDLSQGHAKNPELAAILLLGEQIDFKISGDKLEVDCDVKRFVPQMSEISAKDKHVAQRFNPKLRLSGKGIEGLSAAIPLTTGTLSVRSYFQVNGDADIDFGFVKIAKGVPDYSGIVWQRKVANKLLWRVPLPEDCSEVVLSSTIWDSESSADYVLKVPECGPLAITIMNAEPDVPALFQDDPILADSVDKLPDPDFEVLYSLSSHTGKKRRMRVPLPTNGGAGAETKPCTGGFFEGFK